MFQFTWKLKKKNSSLGLLFFSVKRFNMGLIGKQYDQTVKSKNKSLKKTLVTVVKNKAWSCSKYPKALLGAYRTDSGPLSVLYVSASSTMTSPENETKLHVEPSWGQGTKVCKVWVTWLRWPPHPYMVKPLIICFSKTKCPMTLKLCMQQWWFGSYQVCSKDDPWLTLTYFTVSLRLLHSKMANQWIFLILL